MTRASFVVIVLSLLLLPAMPAWAERPDSNAPAGAAYDWLPAEEWVMERWLPFDEIELERIYGLDRTWIYFYLRDAGDRDRTLLDLARRRDVRVRGLADRLLATRRGNVTEEQWDVLRARTRTVLSQGHLAEHMLGHVFHQWSIWNHVPEIWGLTNERYEALDELTQAQRAAKAGISRGELRARVISRLARSRRRGVASGAISTTEASGMRTHLLGVVDRWIGPAAPRVCRLRG